MGESAVAPPCRLSRLESWGFGCRAWSWKFKGRGKRELLRDKHIQGRGLGRGWHWSTRVFSPAVVGNRVKVFNKLSVHFQCTHETRTRVMFCSIRLSHCPSIYFERYHQLLGREDKAPNRSFKHVEPERKMKHTPVLLRVWGLGFEGWGLGGLGGVGVGFGFRLPGRTFFGCRFPLCIRSTAAPSSSVSVYFCSPIWCARALSRSKFTKLQRKPSIACRLEDSR